MSESASDSPPVDMVCLKRLGAGKSQEVQKLVEFYLQTSTEQLEKLQHAVLSHAAEDVETLAHQCMGASSLMGMTAIVPSFRRLEEMGIKRQLIHAGDALAQARKELERMKSYLDAREKGAGYAQSAD